MSASDPGGRDPGGRDPIEAFEVFIENPRGATTKHLHDERTLEPRGTTPVSRPYPWPYGFIPGTWADDDCCVDCFVITDDVLETGNRIQCAPVALLEQVEDGLIDHNVVATPVGQEIGDLAAVEATLRAFVNHVFTHVPDKVMRVGRLLDRDHAIAHIRQHVRE